MNPEDVLRYEQFLRYELAILDAQDHLLDFARFTMPHPRHVDDPTKSLFMPARHLEVLADFMEGVERGECLKGIINMPPRHGKACADDTPVLTPAGWRQHGDLRPGDAVFGPDGKPAAILDTIRWEPDMLRVTFSNGESVVVHRNHEWTVDDRKRGAKNRTLETWQLADQPMFPEAGGRLRGRWLLPPVAAVEFPDAILPAHPYVLGAWLGDGKKDAARLDLCDEEVFEAIEAEGYRRTASGVHPTTGVLWRSYSGPRPGVRGQLSEQLKRLGLIGKKRIPDLYLRASVDQRMQLLAGLMDTDGSADPHGRCRIVTAETDLADDIMDLCATLGFRPYRMEQAPHLSTSGIQSRRPAITVGFQPTREIPCRVPRKRPRRLAAQRRISISSVEPATASGCQSICIDRADGLYLVGRSLLPTHNTETATIRMNAWFTGRNPAKEILTATYGQTFARKFSIDVQAILEGQRFRQAFPEYRIEQSTAEQITNHLGKNLYFLGRRSPTTGRGGDILLVDDPTKDDREVRYVTYRDDVWEWFTQTLLSRRHHDRAPIIITQTRWHEDDIVGRITDKTNPKWTKEFSEGWEIVNLPAIAEEDDPMGRKPGEALWPERFGLKYLEEMRSANAVSFSSLYQCDPTPAEGVHFLAEDLHTYNREDYERVKPTLRWHAASDHAVSLEQQADPTCMGVFGVDPQGIAYVDPDLVWRKMASDVAIEQMIRLMVKFKPLWWYAERGHISRAIGPFLKKKMEEENVYCPIIEDQAVADPLQRSQSARARCAQGRILFPDFAPWWPKAKLELLKFPNARHDDFVAFLSIIGMKLASHVTGHSPQKIEKAAPGSWAALKAEFALQDRGERERAARAGW